MAIITHGSDLSLAAAVGPLVPRAGGTLRGALEAVARAKLPAVQIDATLAGLRPRELDRRARRDLLATVGRHGLQLAGVDLFIPRKHFFEPEHLDRAMTAALAGIELAADLGRVPLSIALPISKMADAEKKALVEAADGHGIRLAVHAEDQLDALLTWLDELDLPAVGAAIDPAALLAMDQDPTQVVSRFADRLTVARLADFSRSDSPEGGRCPLGEGELDVLAYRVALDLATHRAGPVVLDTRRLDHPVTALPAARQAWDEASPI